jgi:hypothetical protein
MFMDIYMPSTLRGAGGSASVTEAHDERRGNLSVRSADSHTNDGTSEFEPTCWLLLATFRSTDEASLKLPSPACILCHATAALPASLSVVRGDSHRHWAHGVSHARSALLSSTS